MSKDSSVVKAAKVVGAVVTSLVLAAGILVMIADNVFVTHAAAAAQYQALRKEMEDRTSIIDQKEDLHYKEVTRQLDKIDGRVERIYNLLSERK